MYVSGGMPILFTKRSDLSNEETLTLFVNFWNSGEGKEMYADQKKIDDELKTLDDELDIDGIIQ